MAAITALGRRMLVADERLLRSVRRFHSRWRTRAMLALTRVGSSPGWAAITIGLACLPAPARRLGFLIGAAATSSILLTQPVKRLVGRARPKSFDALTAHPDRFSFPSGHAGAAFAVAVALAGEPHGIGSGALLLALGIGSSRIYLGAHYPLDVAAGAALGAVAGSAVRALL